ncbi:MAG: ATP-binding protein [Chloroflexota bacterium]|nr:ATP-binding protein [Chloroflexota bacterium]
MALVELLKNSYDADATIARLVFNDFDKQLRVKPGSTLVIVDNGDGMSETEVREHWLNPATPVKAHRKAKSPKTPKTPKNRTIQGEKGIGRFAIFKLGSAATIITRARGANTELVLDYDLSFLDEALGPERNPSSTFLDEIRVRLLERVPQTFDGTISDGNYSEHGTRIVVRNLRSVWTRQSARRAYDDIARLQPLMPARDFETPEVGDEFRVEFWKDDQKFSFGTDYDRSLKTLFEDRAVLQVDGLFGGSTGEMVLEVDGDNDSMSIHDPELAGLLVYKNYFGERRPSSSLRTLACGPFSFSFFVFDLSGTSPPQFRLDSDDKKLVKGHRIYLYRDGVRVLPYGDPQDDWLQLDVIRGTKGAKRILGNDQTVSW